MKILFIFPKRALTFDAIEVLSQKLSKIMAARFVEGKEFKGNTTDVEVVLVHTSSLDMETFEHQHLIFQADLVIANLFGQIHDYKILKDLRKNVVRDIKEAELFFTLGKYYGLELMERHAKERAETIAQVTDQIENTLQLLHTPTDQSVELNKIRELLISIEGLA